MSDPLGPSDAGNSTKGRPKRPASMPRRSVRHRRYFIASASLAATVVLAVAAAWLGSRATIIKGELEATAQLIPVLKDNIAGAKPQEALTTSENIRSHTAAARDAAGDPLWTLAASIPWIGANFSTISEVAQSADDVAALGVAPLVRVFDSLDWESLLPTSSGSNLEPLQEAAPSVSSAAHAVRVSAERLDSIDATGLWPQVAEPLIRAREQLATVTGALDAAANAAQIAPGMLGDGSPRNYLLAIQNNAEARASGGIPGALAILTLDQGKLTLGAQSSAGDVGVMSPVVSVDSEQEQIYSRRLGEFMQDVNLTPDFPTAATTAQAMWERRTGQRVDGVISMDPVALGYILDATGPVNLTDPELIALADSGLPTELSGKNVVQTLLSDVYSEITQPEMQDAYFAGVAKGVFGALSGGTGDAKGLLKGITRGADEGRLLIWSSSSEEQSILEKYPLSGSIVGPSVAPAQFGVYFNDGTGAKMDYYVKRTVQLIGECTADEYGQVKVRVTSTNTAPTDAASSLPAYVTGDGIYGVPIGTVRTNVVAYGPVQANVETAFVNGAKSDFGSYRHSDRPVAMVTMNLAPGQSSSVDFTFGKIVQHTEPSLVVTPTVQPVKEVVLAAETPSCEPGK